MRGPPIAVSPHYAMSRRSVGTNINTGSNDRSSNRSRVVEPQIRQGSSANIIREKRTSIPLPSTSTSSLPLPNNLWVRNGFGMVVERTKNNGKWTGEEIYLLEQSVQQYCAMRGISVSYLCSSDSKVSDGKDDDGNNGTSGMISNTTSMGDNKRRGAWYEIAKALPHRSVQSIYRKGLRHLGPYHRGDWTKEEENLLLNLVQHYGKKWATVANKLKRSPDGCRDKYREMPERHGYINGRWLTEEIERLLLHVRDVLKVPSSFPLPPSPPASTQHLLCAEDEKNHAASSSSSDKSNNEKEQRPSSAQQGVKESSFDPYYVTPAQREYFSSFVKAIDQYCNQQGKETTIPWSAVSKRMGNRSRLRCFRKWQKLLSGTVTDTRVEEEESEVEEEDEHCREAKRKRKSKSLPKKTTKKKIKEKHEEEESIRAEEIEQPPLITTEPIIIKKEKFKLHNPEDIQLLQQISATEARRPTDIDWAAGLTHPKAFARYQEILDEIERDNDTDELLDMPLASQAKLLLLRSGLH